MLLCGALARRKAWRGMLSLVVMGGSAAGNLKHWLLERKQ
jgi:hypothetical protein